MNHRSIQSTQHASSAHEHLTPCHLLDSGTNEKRFPFKGKFETFKVQTISEIKKLILKKIFVLEEAFQIVVFSGKTQMEKFFQEQLRLMNEELGNKYNLIVSLLNQLPKQSP